MEGQAIGMELELGGCGSGCEMDGRFRNGKFYSDRWISCVLL